MLEDMALARGSSPLARGLLAEVSAYGHANGIIPARAGFTPPRHWCSRRSEDHPRSRGVYRSPLRITPTRPGSSPLARGLRAVKMKDFSPMRIIPARAGFTAGSPPNGSASGDHPRSRGVYGVALEVDPAAVGSSPLARGLRALIRRRPERQRIIPARAGFTSSRMLTPLLTRDHPRSRGVYRFEAAARAFLRWIIPARAGFTRPPRLHAGQRRDHPRSRGVYLAGRLDEERRPGSSPLARGLPGDQRL